MESTLTIMPETDPSKKEIFKGYDVLREKMASLGIGYERWEAEKPLTDTASPEEVAAAYKTSIDRILAKGYKTFDVVSMHPESPNAKEARAKFISEHTHSDDEVRFFVDGSGMFYIHKAGLVCMMLCTKGDFISLPAGTTHWFDMGPKPLFKAIRVFNSPDGWVGNFTGDSIPDRFPKYE